MHTKNGALLGVVYSKDSEVILGWVANNKEAILNAIQEDRKSQDIETLCRVNPCFLLVSQYQELPQYKEVLEEEGRALLRKVYPSYERNAVNPDYIS